jgi:hypothetical protein
VVAKDEQAAGQPLHQQKQDDNTEEAGGNGRNCPQEADPGFARCHRLSSDNVTFVYLAKMWGFADAPIRPTQPVASWRIGP